MFHETCTFQVSWMYCHNVTRSYGLENSLWCLSFGVKLKLLNIYSFIKWTWTEESAGSRKAHHECWKQGATPVSHSFSIVKVRECDVQSWKGILRHVDLSYISSWNSEISVSAESSDQSQMAEFWHLYRMWAWIKRSIPWLWCYSTEWLTVYHTYTYNVHHTYVIILSWCWVI